MMLHKHVLGTVAFLCSASVLASVPIESRGLSQSSSSYSQSTPAAYTNGSSNSAESAPASTNLSWQLMQKNQQLENDLRILRGKIEEQDNEISQLKNELTNRYADLDQRLELLQQKVDPAAEDSNAEDNQQGTAPSSPAAASQPTAVKAPAASIPAPAAKTPPTAASTQQNASELDKAAYTVALDAYKQGGAKKAIAPMQNFIKNNPNSVYISNAHFWLAEFNLAIEPTNYAEAKRNYGIVVNTYPNSSRASRALYQLYSIAKDVDHNAAQAAQYKQKLLKNYPQSEDAKYFK
ncbi:YbgF trimerization domain-containing protein [Acinetobacter pragensis]|uniref:YbgF trimerization domain-containing protein n=1 Tax=Acinetobacter pragensis TaxID=1806892 RepID=UPI00333FD11A